jgi:hypothetical protein
MTSDSTCIIRTNVGAICTHTIEFQFLYYRHFRIFNGIKHICLFIYIYIYIYSYLYISALPEPQSFCHQALLSNHIKIYEKLFSFSYRDLLHKYCKFCFFVHKSCEFRSLIYKVNDRCSFVFLPPEVRIML